MTDAKIDPAIEKRISDAIDARLSESIPMLIDQAIDTALTREALEKLPVSIHLLRGELPKRQTEGASGYDLHYNPPKGFTASDARPQPAVPSPGVTVDSLGNVTLYDGARVLLPTGIRLAIPGQFEGQIRSRSGLASRGIIVVNQPGTIDSDYRGEVKVLLAVASQAPVTIKPGDRIAQLVFTTVYAAEFEALNAKTFDELSTERAEGGFGSTGVRS